MRLALLLPLLVACGSAPAPVATPTSVAIAPNECSSFTLQSYRGGRAPTPATNVSVTVVDPALAKTVVEDNKVHVFATGTGTTKLEVRYLDPATKREEHQTVAVEVRTPAKKDTPYPMQDKAHARCEELRARLSTP